MKISYLQEFIVLSEYLNFSMAAEHLFISQPVLSRHISALEEEFQTQLFVRDTKTVKLTEAGEIFRKKAQKIMMEYEDLKEQLKLCYEGFNSKLSIGVPYFAISDYLGDIPNHFAAENPTVQLTYEVGSPNRILRAIEGDRVDFGILPHLTYPSSCDIVFKDVFEEQIGILVKDDDPLAKLDSCTIADLKNYTFFQIGGFYFSSTATYLRKLCNQAGFEPKFTNVPLMESALVAARGGSGIIAVGAHMRHQAGSGLSYIPLTGEKCSRMVAVCYKREYADNKNVKKFIAMYCKNK